VQRGIDGRRTSAHRTVSRGVHAQLLSRDRTIGQKRLIAIDHLLSCGQLGLGCAYVGRRRRHLPLSFRDSHGCGPAIHLAGGVRAPARRRGRHRVTLRFADRGPGSLYLRLCRIGDGGVHAELLRRDRAVCQQHPVAIDNALGGRRAGLRDP